jgi:hypothetical protein
MAANSVRWEESSEIVIDQEMVLAAAGWTIKYASVNRIGALVAVHLELSFAAHAPAFVATLPAPFAPGQAVNDPADDFTIAPSGAVTYSASTAAPATVICQLVYQAAESSP